MSRLLEIADRYIAESDWKTISVLKFCLLSLGIAAGLIIPVKYKRPVLIACEAVFAVTYLPLMAKFFKTAAAVLNKEVNDV